MDDTQDLRHDGGTVLRSRLSFHWLTLTKANFAGLYCTLANGCQEGTQMSVAQLCITHFRLICQEPAQHVQMLPKKLTAKLVRYEKGIRGQSDGESGAITGA